MTERSAEAVRSFAAKEGLDPNPRPRMVVKRRHRLALRLARAVHMDRSTTSLVAHRRSLMHAEPVFGSLLFRWAVSVVRPRYRDARADGIRLARALGTEEPVDSAIIRP